MKEAVEAIREFFGVLISLVNQPNALTIISVGLLILAGKHYWREINAKIALCEEKHALREAQHSRCERRFNIIARLLHGALQYDEAVTAVLAPYHHDQRSGERRQADMARAQGMMTLRKTLDDLLKEIEHEEKVEEDELVTGERK